MIIKLLLQFSLKIMLAALVSIVCAYFLFTKSLHITPNAFFYAMYLFLAGLTISIYGLVIWLKQKGTELVAPSILGSIGFKMLSSLSLLAVYIYKVEVEVVSYSLLFVFNYFVFTFIEVVELVKILKEE